MVQKEGTEYLLCGLVTDVMTNGDVTFRGVDWPWFILNYPNQSQLIMINPQLPCDQFKVSTLVSEKQIAKKVIVILWNQIKHSGIANHY